MKAIIKIRARFLLSMLAILVLGTTLVFMSAEAKEDEYEALQVGAAERMMKAEAYLKERILEKGIEIELTDINQTALVGPEFTELTTTPGDEKAKRSALNPQFASLLIRYFKRAGLEEGDPIAIGVTGSFPGFVIASLTAATEMKLDTRLIVSCGSSMHGATRVEYNVFDIVNDLKESGLADFTLLAISPGGPGDRGGSVLEGILYEDTDLLALELCKEESEKTGAELIYKDKLADSIKRRRELYGDVKMFINVGGASVNSGESTYSLAFPHGLVLDPPKIPTSPTRGLNYEFAAEGIPVINLLSVKLICQDNGIPFDPVPLPSSFEGQALPEVEYSKPLAGATLALVLWFFIWGLVDAIKRRDKNEEV